MLQFCVMRGETKLFEIPTQRTTGEFQLPADDLAESRIVDIFERATDEQREAGLNWYHNAHLTCMHLVDQFPERQLDVVRVAGIAAALSPQASWEQNIGYVETLLRTGTAPTLTHAIDSALAIRDGACPVEVLHHPSKNNLKVRSFFDNIANPYTSDAVTIDRHAWNLIFNDPKAIRRSRLYIKPTEYHWAADRYRSVAERLGCQPHQLQAATWLVWKPTTAGDIAHAAVTATQPRLFSTQKLVEDAKQTEPLPAPQPL